MTPTRTRQKNLWKSPKNHHTFAASSIHSFKKIPVKFRNTTFAASLGPNPLKYRMGPLFCKRRSLSNGQFFAKKWKRILWIPWLILISWRSIFILIPNTPLKINMEPENHPFEKENDLPNLHDMFHVNLPGCNESSWWFFTNPFETYTQVKLEHFPKNRDENRNQHLGKACKGPLDIASKQPLVSILVVFFSQLPGCNFSRIYRIWTYMRRQINIPTGPFWPGWLPSEKTIGPKDVEKVRGLGETRNSLDLWVWTDSKFDQPKWWWVFFRDLLWDRIRKTSPTK